MGALEMKVVETAFLFFELAVQWGQAVMGTEDVGVNGECSEKRVYGWGNWRWTLKDD